MIAFILINVIICQKIQNIEEPKIEHFFDELKLIYLEWIDAKTIQSIQRFMNLLKEFNLLSFEKEIKEFDIFFKARSSNQVLTRWDMFHIPFNKRYLIGNQRFSLTGQPMLYVGSSVLDVAEEIGIDKIADMKISYVQLPQKGLKIFDLRNNLAEEYDNLLFSLLIETETTVFNETYFFKMILASVCSFQKRQDLKGYTFCEEYVLPQILAQILKEQKFDGIAYYSTKRYNEIKYNTSNDFEIMDYKENIAIFTSLNEDHVYDKELFDKITISVPVDIKKIENVTINDLEEIIKEIGQSKGQEKIVVAEKLFFHFKRIYEKINISNESYFESEYGRLHMYEIYSVLNNILIA